MPKNNVFFTAALNRARKLLGKETRLLLLVSKLTQKLMRTNFKEVNAKAYFFTLGRMVKAYAQGHYRDVPWKTMLLITAAIVYFVNPLDLIPDLIPGLGLTDDFGVLMYVYTAIQAEVEKFVQWEKIQKA